MNPSQRCIDLVKASESCVLQAYPDPGTNAEPWTIGYGSTHYCNGDKVNEGDSCTQEQADDLLMWELTNCGSEVSRLVSVPLNQNQFDALCDFVYNLGAENLKESTLLRLLNAGDYEGAAEQFKRWNLANGRELPGLTIRRKAEQDLFLEDV